MPAASAGAHRLSTVSLNNTRTFFTRLRQWSSQARDICVRAIINRFAWQKVDHSSALF